MKGKKGMNLAAVIMAVIFMLVYTVPTLRNASNVEDCSKQGGVWSFSDKVCQLTNEAPTDS